MLKEMRLTNFRGFDDEVTLRLRPITVLIGKNNAGKSSLIKFILMLQQSLDPAAAAFLDSEGQRANLGAFSGLRHSRSKRRTLTFLMRFETADVPSAEDVERFRKLLHSAAAIESTPTIHGVHIAAPTPRDDDGHRSGSSVRERVAQYELRVTVHYGRSAQRGKQEIDATIDGVREFWGTTGNLGRGGLLSLPPEGQSYATFAGAFVSERYLQPLRYELRSVRHLGPMRVESQHAIITASPPVDDVGQRGEFALPHLREIMNSADSRAAFVSKHLAMVAGVQSIRFDSSASDYLAHARARNHETGAWVYLSDFGFGVSQCLPVVVQGALMPPHHLLMVEQPEAQLHPTAQLEMGELFGGLWTERQVASVIETHSSNILLRLRRLIAQRKLSHMDVSVAYVTTRERMPIIKNLNIDPDGKLEPGLPMEFFGQDIVEGIKLGAKK